MHTHTRSHAYTSIHVIVHRMGLSTVNTVFSRSFWNLGDTQSGPFGEIICRMDVGTSVGHLERHALILALSVMSFLASLSAIILSFSGKCPATTLMSKWATKNHMHRSRCITTSSLQDPLLIAVTTLRLSFFTNISILTMEYPQITIANTIGTSSFAMMVSSIHSVGHCSCSHL